jgi:hypothetical protein
MEDGGWLRDIPFWRDLDMVHNVIT